MGAIARELRARGDIHCDDAGGHARWLAYERSGDQRRRAGRHGGVTRLGMVIVRRASRCPARRSRQRPHPHDLCNAGTRDSIEQQIHHCQAGTIQCRVVRQVLKRGHGDSIGDQYGRKVPARVERGERGHGDEGGRHTHVPPPPARRTRGR